MKRKIWFLVILSFVLAFTTACGGSTPAAPADAPAEEAAAEAAPTVEEPAVDAPTAVPPTEVPTETPAGADFPLPDDAANLSVDGEGVTSFETVLSMPDVVTFYRFALPNLIERESETSFTDTAFRIVFDGHESGEPVIIEGAPAGNLTGVKVTYPATPVAVAATEPPAEETAAEPTAVEPAPTAAATTEPAAVIPTPRFPLPDDATNVIIVSTGVTTFQTALSMPDVVTFYRFAFPNYTEREELTTFGDTFNLVFDGHESGKSVIVQGFILNEQGVVSVSIRLGDA